jgi:hypothetical protein
MPEQREKGEWIEGVAIWVAIFLVAGVGEYSLGACVMQWIVFIY